METPRFINQVKNGMFLDPIDYKFQVFHYVRLGMSGVRPEII